MIKKTFKIKSLNKRFFNNFFIFLYLVFLPTQFGKHFFLSFSYLNGIRVDYLAPTIYFNDLIFLILLFLNINLILKFKRLFFGVSFFFLINLFFSLLKLMSFYYWLRFFQWMIIFLIFKKTFISSKKILIAFFTSSIIEMFLAVYHLIFGRSIQSFFYFLGERAFSLSTPSIAKGILFDKEFLRPYGTFSHPNSLAGFYLLLYFFILTSKRFNNSFYLKNLSLLFFSFLVLISFSKIAVFTFLFLNFIYYFSKIKKCLFCFFAKFFIFFILGLIFLTIQTDPLTLEKRVFLLKNSLSIFLKHPFGVGLGNYLIAQNQIPEKIYLFFNQPVHNIFLLLLNELGVFLCFLIGYLLIKKVKILKLNFYLLTIIFLTGSFDHYWLTLPQNFFLAAVIFGLI